MNRRTFIKTSSALCGLTLAGVAALNESCSKSGVSTSPQGPTVNFSLDLSQATNSFLNQNGGSVYSNGVIVANINGTFVALAQACTHMGCSINYNQSGTNFVCPCHNGIYSTNGSVVSGPPPAPLKKYTISKNGTILTISG